jgi:D-3-phosphoglycerate dehydrogenase
MSKVMVFPGVFGKFSDSGDKILAEAGLEVTKFYKAGMTEDEVIEKLQGYDGVILGLEPMTAKVLDACKDLKVVSRFGVGMDNVDREAAKRNGVKVYNTPAANAGAVADYTFGLMLGLARSVATANRDTKNGEWKKYTGYPVYGATIGIIGLGAIGKEVAMRAKGFQMRIMAYDIYWDEAFVAEYGVEKASLDEIYEQADFVTLHTGVTEETRNMIDMNALKKMKKTAFLLNCARGALVNEEDLYQAVKEGVIAGAGLDAFCTEPPTGSPLLTLDNVLVAPHIAGSSIDAINKMTRMSAQNVADGLLGK